MKNDKMYRVAYDILESNKSIMEAYEESKIDYERNNWSYDDGETTEYWFNYYEEMELEGLA